ncbi:zinc finger protein 513-like isoform X2 [Thalassophryne amazonica]|uniref:zinc finger protein 513-like isoform X2 n=1 Tax=Thalassophryne amazonica TaxID=390379 RepID=UPI001471721F|nr:zinc finger protein 513-like isoform X2 [Thalassophryne amazonica]
MPRRKQSNPQPVKGVDLGAELCLSCEGLQSKQQPASDDSSLLGGLNKTINSDSSSKSRNVNTADEGGKVSEKMFSCSLCSFASRYSNHLKRHRSIHDGEKPYRCYICPYASAQLVNLQRHARTHTGEKPYGCHQCTYACSSLSNLRRHQRMHSQAKPPQQKKEKRRARRKTTDGETEEVVTLQVSQDSGFLRTLGGALGSPSALLPALLFPLCCQLCGLTLEDADLDVDKVDSQGDSDGGQICRRCSWELLTKDEATPPQSPVTSQGSRTGQRGTKICYCHAHLTHHAHIHSEEKPHRCPRCPYTSSHLNNLKRHLRVHTGEKPYCCPVCSYACGNLANLRRHERIHSGAKPFLCSVCSYSCNQSMNLKRHMLRHTGEKPYACTECGYTTGHWDNYKRHQRKRGHNTGSWDRHAHAAALRWTEEPQDRHRPDTT